MNLRLTFGALLFFFGLTLMTGCGLSEFDEEIDTQFTVPKPKSGVFGLEPFTKTKRFTLGSDPGDAERVTITRARIQVLAPLSSDLSILDRLEVYVEKDSELTLLGEATGFAPQERLRNLDIVFKDDIRSFVTEENKVVLVFVVFPSTFAPTFPEDGITLQADMTVRIELL